MTYLNLGRRISECRKCGQTVDNTRTAKQRHDRFHLIAARAREARSHQDRQPVSMSATFTRWMAEVDGCPGCPNVQPPRAVIPSALPGCEFTASYQCTDCGATWVHTYKDGEV